MPAGIGNMIVRPAGGAVVTPATIFGADLVLWLRADMGITLNGSTVAAWADQSGSGLVASFAQTNAGDQPTYVASGINGKPHVLGGASGTTVLIGNGTLLATDDFTIAAIIEGSSATTDRGIFGMRYNAHQYCLAQGYNVAGRAQYVDYDGTVATSDGAINDGAPHVVAVTRHKGGVSTIYVDGTTASAVTGATADTITAAGADKNAALGIAHSTSIYGQGYVGAVAEIVMAKRVASAGDLAALWAYQRAWAGI